jgi:hypothetical protein
MALLVMTAAGARGIVAAGGADPTASPAVSPAGLKAFAVFDSSLPQPSSATMTVGGEVLRPGEGVGFTGIRDTSARLAQSNASYQIAVFGNTDTVCILARQPQLAASGGCMPIAVVATGDEPTIVSMRVPRTTGQASPPGRLLNGLLPDGIASVTVSDARSTSTVAIVNNTFATVIGPEPTSVGWTTHDGATHTARIIQ